MLFLRFFLRTLKLVKVHLVTQRPIWFNFTCQTLPTGTQTISYEQTWHAVKKSETTRASANTEVDGWARCAGLNGLTPATLLMELTERAGICSLKNGGEWQNYCQSSETYGQSVC